MPVTYAEQDLATLSGEDFAQKCGNDVTALYQLLQEVMQYPRPHWTAHVGTMAKGMQQVLLGIHYDLKDVTKAGLKQIGSALTNIEKSYANSKMDEDGDWCGTGWQWLWLQQLMDWLRHHPHGPTPPGPDPDPWYRQLDRFAVAIHEIVLAGAIENVENRKTVAAHAFKHMDMALSTMQAMKM
jgi:hypothetical protein